MYDDPAIHARRAPHPRGAVHQPDDRHHRQHRPQRGPAAPGARPRREHHRPPVDGRCLLPRVRRDALHRRHPRRPVRAQGRAAGRAGPVPVRHAAGRHRRLLDRGDRRSGRDGAGRRLRHAGHALHPHQRVPTGGAPQGHRRLGGHRRRRRRHRTGRLRLPARALLVGLRVPRQRAGHHPGAGRGAHPDPDVPRSGGASARHPRRAALDRRAELPRLRHHRRPAARLDEPREPRHLRVRRAGHRPVHPPRAAHAEPDARPALLPGSSLQRVLRRHDPDLLRHVRHVLPGVAVLPARARATPPSSRASSSSRWRA